MTVQELYIISASKLKIISGYNGKILCRDFNPKKHNFGEREVRRIWSEISLIPSTFGSNAESIMCAFVDGREEYEKENEKVR